MKTNYLCDVGTSTPMSVYKPYVFTAVNKDKFINAAVVYIRIGSTVTYETYLDS